MTMIHEFRKASASAEASNCVEVGVITGRRGERLVVVRDSKDPDSPRLRFTPAEWRAFVDGVRRGEFDLA